MESFSDEQMNYFKFGSIVLDVFLATLRQVFVSMWDRLAARTPGCQNWDDSTTVRNMFLAQEGGKIDNIPTDKSYLEWDCTALFQATLFSQTFALPDEYGKRRTLYQLYVKPLPIGTFHDCVLSPTGNTAETWALALDQLHLLRNTLCQLSTVQMMDKTTFDHYLMLARDAFTALEQNSIGIDSIEELTEDNFPSAKIQQLKLGLERENCIVIEFKQVNNHLNAIKSQTGIQVESDKWQCSHGHLTFYLRNVINEIVSMKKDEQSDKRKKDLKLLLSCLEEEVKMDLLENLNAERQGVACIICKAWIFRRVIYFILTDKGVNSDNCVDAASGSGNSRDPDVFLFSPPSDPKKKSPFVVVWKTPSVLEMKELSHVGSTLHESILMLFLQPQFQKNCVVDQDFYMELTLPTYATSSLCTQIMYLPVLVVLELSKSNKDCSNIDSIVNLPSIHVSIFSYRFSNQRHAEFVFDNLICSLGKLLAVTEVQHAVISPLHNVAIYFFLEAKFSNSSLSVVVEKDSVIVKCYSICEFESTCICLSVRNSLESEMESLSHDFRTSWKSRHLELHCEEGGISHHCKDVNREPPCSGLASESTNACACACGSNPLYALEGEQSISLPQKKDETNIGHADLGDAPLDGPLWCILEYADLESVYTKSDLQASVSDEVPLPDSAHCDVSKQLDTSLLSVCSNSSLNSCPTTPSDPAQEAPDFYEHAPQNSSMASVDCSASNFASQENSSQLSSGVNNLQDCSVMKSSYEEGLSSLSGKDFFDTKARKVEPSEVTVEETPKEPKCDLQDAHSSYNTESVALPCTASQRSPDPSVLTDLPRNQEGTVAMQISQLQSDIAFYQHQCSEERQRSTELEEKLKQSEEEKMQLKAEVGRYQFLECKEKRSEKILHSSTTLISEQSKSCPTNGWCSAFTGTAEKLLGGAGNLQEPRFALQQILLEISNSLSETELKQMKFLVKPKLNAFRLAKIREGFELFDELDASGVSSCTYLRELLKGIQRFDLLEKLDVSLFTSAESADGAFCIEQGPEQEPRSHPPTRQRMLDRITQSSSSPQGDHNLDLLPDDTMMEKPSLLSSGDNLLQVQSSYEEGLTTAEGDLVTETRETDKLENQPRPQLYHPTDMEPRDGMDSLHQHNNRKPDSKRKRMFLSAKNDDDVERLIITAAERDSQEQIERLQRELHECEVENQILQAELKTTSFPVDQHISSENIFQLSREHAVGVASHVEKDLHDGACSLPGARSHSPTGQTLLNRITESSVLPPIDHNPDLLPPRHDGGFDETSDGIHTQDNGGVWGINEAGPIPNMSCTNSVNSGNDTIVLANNPDGEDSSVHRRYHGASKSVSFSNESSSTTASSSELSVSSMAEPTKVESTSSSCAVHSVCDSSSRVTLCQLTAVKNHKRFSDTCSIGPTSGEEETLENILSNEYESGSIDTREDCATKNEEIGKVSESSGDISEGPRNPHHLKAKSAVSVAKDVVDCGPLRSPDRPGAEARSQQMPGLKQDVLPNGDISEEQNVSGAFIGAGESSTVDQLVSDASTQSKLWARLGARPRDRPPMKMAPPPQTSLIDLVPQRVAEPMASGLANAFLARHSQDQSLHESLCQGSAVKLFFDQTSSQGASYMDGTKHSSELNKAKPYFGDCRVDRRPDVDSRWMFPPPEPGVEYDSYNAVGGYAYNTQLNVTQFNGHVGPLSGYVTGGTNNFSSSNAFNSSNYNSFKRNLALAAREPDLTLHRQRDCELNTSVPGNQRLHSGITGAHIANVSLMGAAGLQLTPPVHALQRYSDPSDNASTVASEREQTQPAWKANSRLTSIGNMARVDVRSSGLPAPLIASRSNGVDNRHVLEAGSSRTSQLGTGGSDLVNTSGDRVVAGASRDVDSTHTETALLSAESRGSQLVGSANGDSNLEPRGAEASLVPVNTGGSILNRDFGTDSVESTDNSLLALEQRVEEACALVERVLREREEREQFGREIERKEREIRERRARKKREREAREQEEASRWPQQQEAITGRSQWLCEHYQRHCRVRFPCCSHFYSCHRCHNNSKACDNEEAKASHATHLKCSFCQHEQEIGEDSGKCRSCGAQMSAYFCSICKHFTSVDKNPYHCEKCGICRIHKDKSFHCEVCNVCLDKRLEGKHKCRPDSGHDECCICLEDAFSGCQILPCSHKVHRECAIAMVQNGIRTCPVCRHPLYNQASE